MKKKLNLFCFLLIILLITGGDCIVSAEINNKCPAMPHENIKLNKEQGRGIIQKINKLQEAINYREATVYQWKLFSFMKTPLETEGILKYHKGNSIKWEVTSPSKNSITSFLNCSSFSK